LPPLPEQHAIAATLSCLDEKIANNKAINHHLEQMAQAVFKSWFVDFEPWGGVQPVDWRVVILGDLVQIIDNRGKTPPFAPIPTDYPVIDVKALSGSQRVVDFKNCTKFVEAETYHSWFRSGHPQPYDILLSTVGSLAEMKLFFGNRGCIAQNVVGFRSEMPLYLYQYLQYIKDDLVSYNIGSVQPSIKVTHITKHPILVPTNEILQQFNEFVQSITEEIYTKHCQNELLATLRDTLLPRLMSGELSVADLCSK
jgi:type I restriction enzyme S subunit